LNEAEGRFRGRLLREAAKRESRGIAQGAVVELFFDRVKPKKKKKKKGEEKIKIKK